MKFVKAGQTCKPRNWRPPSVLQLATDWRISADLPHLSYQFPLHIAVTAQRPDVVIWSESLRTIILLELTVRPPLNHSRAVLRRTCTRKRASTLASEPNASSRCLTGRSHRIKNQTTLRHMECHWSLPFPLIERE